VNWVGKKRFLLVLRKTKNRIFWIFVESFLEMTQNQGNPSLQQPKIQTNHKTLCSFEFNQAHPHEYILQLPLAQLPQKEIFSIIIKPKSKSLPCNLCMLTPKQEA
jgi:hypothetical protein